MAIIGNDTKPGFAYHAYGGTSQINQEAEDVTLPAGRIRITRLGAWIGGWNDSPRVMLTIWNPSTGAVLGQSVQFAVSNQGAAGGGKVTKYVADLVTPYEANGGAVIRVGFTRHRDDAHQVSTGTTTPAGHEHGRGAYPAGGFAEIDGGYAENRRIGAWIDDYQPIRGGWVYRGGAWIRADQLAVIRSGVAVQATSVLVYRGTSWIEAD